MNKFVSGALCLVAAVVLFISGSAARAQSADGLLDTIKGVVSDPLFSSLLMSKFASPASLDRKVQSPSFGSSAYGSGTNSGLEPPAYAENVMPDSRQFATGTVNPGFNFSGANLTGLNYPQPVGGFQPGRSNMIYTGPHPGFYSLEQGAALGGTDYDPSLLSRTNMADSNSAAGRNPVYSGAAPSFPRELIMKKHLDPSELRQLSCFDISVLIDRSASMATQDCPGDIAPGRFISRWQWCKEQSAMLSHETAGAMPAGITIIPFADNWQRFAGVSPAGINGIFAAETPAGSTNLAGALQAELDRYFVERDRGYRQRPFMIAVITDGVPDSKTAVRRVIREAVRQMSRPDEIKIVFFLIGQDENGADFVDELAGRMKDEFVPLNIISQHSFREVHQIGLARSLASSAIR